MENEKESEAEFMGYYQELLKTKGFTGITDLLAEVTRLRAIIDEANAQKPFIYRKEPHKGWPEYSEINEFSDGFGGGLALYAAPIPAQQSPAVAVPDWIIKELKRHLCSPSACDFHGSPDQYLSGSCCMPELQKAIKYLESLNGGAS